MHVSMFFGGTCFLAIKIYPPPPHPNTAVYTVYIHTHTGGYKTTSMACQCLLPLKRKMLPGLEQQTTGSNTNGHIKNLSLLQKQRCFDWKTTPPLEVKKILSKSMQNLCQFHHKNSAHILEKDHVARLSWQETTTTVTLWHSNCDKNCEMRTASWPQLLHIRIELWRSPCVSYFSTLIARTFSIQWQEEALMQYIKTMSAVCVCAQLFVSKTRRVLVEIRAVCLSV